MKEDPPRRLRALIFEDTPADAELMVHELRRAGFDLDWQRVDTEAEYLAHLGPGVGLILADYSLPQFSAPAALRRLQERGLDIPFIVVTGAVGEERVVECMKQGAADYLLKDRLARLGPAVVQALEQKQFRTERRQTEETLKAAQAYTRNILDSSLDMIIAVDQERRITEFNRAAQESFGYGREEVLGKPVDLLYADPEEGQRVHATTQIQGRCVQEIRNRRKNGEVFPSFLSASVLGDAQGRQVGLVGISRDITRRKQEEARQQAVQRVREAVWKMRSEDDLQEVLKVLKASLEQLDIPFQDCDVNIAASDHLPAMHAFCINHAGAWSVNEVAHQARPLVLRFWEKGEPVYRRDLEAEDLYQEKANIERIFNHPVRSVLDLPFAQGTLAVNSSRPEAFSESHLTALQALAAVLEEGFHRLEDLQALKHKEEQFHQAQKMEAVGRLAGGVAHDFNNLLTVINGYSDLLLGSLSPEDPQHENLREIQDAGRRAEVLVRQLLAFSRRQVLRPQVVDLNAVVIGLEKMLRRIIGEDIGLSTALDPQLGKVYADPGQLEQVLMNLVVNARDAMPQGGKLTLETADVEVDENYIAAHAVEVQPGPCVLLALSDTGTGMDAATQARIFEPFFTTKEPDKGTGLGLAVVYGIVQQSNGYIQVCSEPGQGTIFKLYLPRVETDAGEPRPRETGASEKGLRGQETLLVVEDDDGIRRLAVRALRGQGYTVLEAQNGIQALQVLSRHSPSIQLMLTDVVMPGMSGIELAEQVGKLYPQVMILYMSGYAEHAALPHDLWEMEKDFIQKPFDLDTLVRQVGQVLRG